MMNRYALLLTAALGMAAAQNIPAIPVKPASPSPSAAPSGNSGNAVRNALRDPILIDARITMNTGTYVGPLSVLLTSIAKSAGYEVIFNFNVDALALINGEIVTSGAAVGGAAAAAGANAAQIVPNAPIVYATPLGRPLELPAKPVAHNFVSKPFNEVWPLLMDVYEMNYEVVKLGDGKVIRISQRPRQLSIALSNITASVARDKATEFFGEAYYTEEEYRDAAGNRVTRRVFGGYRLPDTLKILADADSNRLIVGGTNEQADKVRSFISTIDIPKSATPTIAQGQVIYTAKSSPADVSTIVQSQFPSLKVTPIAQTARVIITGPQSDLDAALKLLAQVDQTVNSGSKQIVQRVYSVNGRQEDVVALLGKQYPALNVSPMGTTGQIVVSGPEDQLGEALKLLAQVDRPVSAAPDPKLGTQVYSAKGKSDDVTKFLTAQYPGLKVTPIGTTERLVISGQQDQLSAALALLGQVDMAAPVAASTVQRVFTLINASAEEVKATLEGTLARDVTPSTLTPNATLINPVTGQPYVSGPLANLPLQPQTTGTAAADGAATPAAQPVTIIADKRTNAVIVRGTPDQVEQVAQLIPQLDQKVPQINVQVRIQEITETAARSLGMDWKIGFGGFQVSAGSGGLGAAFNPTQSLMGFNLGATLNTLQNQGLSKSVYDGAITMQSGQRSLSSEGQTQNASGTAAASVKSGGRLELNIPSAAANVPGIQKQIDYGVNLDFYSPQVAPDGSITMRVRGQVNDLTTVITAATVPNLLQFTNSEAQTTLTFKSGETLLLSGLLKTKESKNNDGVPFLSSIPVIGGLFGKESIRKEQTQLLVVITGNIIK
ncbi:NolW-like domain-containing protein [Deinococcus saxicola]